MLRRFQPKAVPASKAPFSQVLIDDHYAFLSGLVAADFPAGESALGDVGAETCAVLTVIREILAELGLNMDRIVRADVHLSDLNEFDAMDIAYREFFPAGTQPARTTTESKRLFGDSRVEITCQARL
jgi:2-iminobutanoate/2-iminopropanoate deaminase